VCAVGLTLRLLLLLLRTLKYPLDLKYLLPPNRERVLPPRNALCCWVLLRRWNELLSVPSLTAR